MPADALPVPWPEPLTGAVHYRREYRDILGRPMQAGKVTITSTDGGTPVIVGLVAGVLEVDLPAGSYRLSAKVRNVDGFSVTETDEVTLTV